MIPGFRRPGSGVVSTARLRHKGQHERTTAFPVLLESVKQFYIRRGDVHGNVVSENPLYERTIAVETEISMNKAIFAMIVAVFYFPGHPGQQYVAWLGDLKLDVIAAAISLLSMTWIAS
jgi:hypothetical protein